MLGLSGAHPTGKQPGLVLFELHLEDLELTLRFVQGQFQLTQVGASALKLFLEGSHPLMRLLVLLELWKGLTLVEEAIDLSVQGLDVEEVGEAGQLHASRRQ